MIKNYINKYVSIIFLVFSTILCLSLINIGAKAQTYLSLFGGTNIAFDGDISDKFLIAGTLITADGTLELDKGVTAGATVGKKFGNFSTEIELSYRSNDLDTFTVETLGALGGSLAVNLGNLDIDGALEARSAMANVWFHVPAGKINPYVGGGIGISQITFDVDSIAGTTSTYDESDTVLAYQAGAGLIYPLSQTMKIDLGYRFFGANNPVFDDGIDEVEIEYQNHSLMLRLIFEL
jgi:opacity protein-like surface antigen